MKKYNQARFRQTYCILIEERFSLSETSFLRRWEMSLARFKRERKKGKRKKNRKKGRKANKDKTVNIKIPALRNTRLDKRIFKDN